MHKIDSNPAPKNWTLYYRDGLPIIGHASVSMRYMEKEEILERGYTPSPDMPIYSAKIRPIGTDCTATSPVKFITDPLVGTGKVMELIFPSQEIIALLNYIATGQVPAADGWLTVRFTFKRIGARVFATLCNYAEIAPK